tara:strand:+ start:172 stop:366 length:195 start_codon:yes stop_codon:yes gene_type:complete
MKKGYSIKKASIAELLNDIDSFETKMVNFIKKFPRYDYTINITNDEDSWIGEVNITKHEKTKTT